MKNLTEREFIIAKEIIHSGLVSAAKQLSFFMKETVEVMEIDLNQVENPLQASLGGVASQEDDLYLLTTDIIGELGGCCFLILTQDQADSLRSRALPPNIIQNPSFYNEMKDAILLEVDNIITASVITQFANHLQRSLHGSVPRMELASKTETEQLISEQANKNIHIIEFYAKFYSSSIDFKPLFVWYLDPHFVACIKEYASSK